MFTVEAQQLVFEAPLTSVLPKISYSIQEAWQYDDKWLAIVCSVDRYPSYRDQLAFHVYEGVNHASLAQYDYCLLGQTMLVLPNQKGRLRLFPSVGKIVFPWGSEIVYDPLKESLVEVSASLGTRSLQVGI